MYIKLVDGVPKPYSILQLRQDNPQISFPAEVPASSLKEFDVYEVVSADRPSFDSMTHELQASDVQNINGQWQVTYSAVELPRAVAEQNVRDKRNTLLAETDWVSIAAYEQNQPVSSAWQNYRQSLRDLTKQQGFPYVIVWPTKPR